MSDRQIIEVNTLEEFTERIQHLDWYFSYSDDAGVYQQGKKQLAYYEGLIKNGPEWVDAWDRQRAIVFSPERGF